MKVDKANTALHDIKPIRKKINQKNFLIRYNIYVQKLDVSNTYNELTTEEFLNRISMLDYIKRNLNSIFLYKINNI